MKLLGYIDKLFKLLPGDKMKTLIGAAVVVVGALIGFINEILPVLPDYPAIDEILVMLSSSLDFLEMLANFLGYSYMSVGMSHKVVKKYAPTDSARTVFKG